MLLYITLFRSADPVLLGTMLSTWAALFFFFKLAVIVGRHLGLEIEGGETTDEIPFFLWRFLINYCSLLTIEGNVFCI